MRNLSHAYRFFLQSSQSLIQFGICVLLIGEHLENTGNAEG